MASFYNNKISTTYVSIIKSLDNAALTASLKELSDGSGNATGLFMNTGGDFKVTNILEWGTLKDTGENISITKFVDEADGIANNDNDTTIPTTAAIVDYVASRITLEDLDFRGDDSTVLGSVDLDSQIFAIVGTSNEIETSTSAGSQQLQIGLPNNVTISGNLQVNGLLKGNNNLVVKDTSDRTMAAFYGGNKVELYFNDSKKFETTSDGVTVTGGLTATASSVFTSASFSGTITGNVTGDLTGNVTATSVLANGVTATTQSSSDNSTKVATTAYVDAQAALTDTLSEVLAIGNTTGGTSVSVSIGDNINFSDSSMAIFGTGSDLKIYHDGSTSYIKDVGTGNLQIETNDLIIKSPSATETLASFATNGAVELYFNDNKKLETTSDGATVTGGLTATGGSVFTGATFSADVDWADNAKARFGAGNDLEIYHDASNSYIVDSGTGNLNINATNLALNNAGGTKTYILGTDGGSVQLRHNDNTKVETTSTGITVTGVAVADGLDMGDSDQIRLGNSQDLLIFHDGSNSYVRDNGTGGLVLEGSTMIELKSRLGEIYLRGNENSSVQLYYNNNIKLNTSATGVSVTGVTDTDGITSSAEIDVDLASEGKYFEGGSGSTRRLSITTGTNTSAHALHTFNIASSNGKYKFDIDGTEQFSVDASNASLGGNLTIAGDLTVNGTTTTINTSTIAVEDSMIEMAKDNAANSLDIGTYGKYNDGSARYLGLFSDASDSNKFKLFKNLTVQPTTTVDTSDASFALADLDVAGLTASGSTSAGVLTLKSTAASDLTITTTAANTWEFSNSGNNSVYNGYSHTFKNGSTTGLTINNLGNSTFAGAVRINATTTTGLVIASQSGASNGLKLYNNSSTDNAYIYNHFSGNLEIGTNNATVLTMNGTLSTFAGNVTANGIYTAGNSAIIYKAQRNGGAVAGDWSYDDATTDMSLGTSTGHSFSLKTNNTRALTIDSSQNTTFAGKIITTALQPSYDTNYYNIDGTISSYSASNYMYINGLGGANGQGLRLMSEGAATNIIGLENSNNSIFFNTNSALALTLDSSQNATFAGTITSGALSVGSSGTSRFTDTSAFPLQINRGLDTSVVGTNGVLLGFGSYSSGTTYVDAARIGANLESATAGDFFVQVNNGGTYTSALTINNDTNATFAGDVRINGWIKGGDDKNTLFSTLSTGVLLQTSGNTAANDDSKIKFRNSVGTVSHTFDANNGDSTFAGTVQVDGSNLTVLNASDPVLTVSDTDTNYRGSMRFNTTDNTLEFFTRFAGTFYTNNLVLKQGMCGIGTNSPQNLLHLKSNDPKLILEDGDAGTDEKVYAIYPAGSQYVLQTMTDAHVSAQNAYVVDRTGTAVDTHKWYTANSERMRITSGGDVLINHTNTSKGVLDVASDSDAVHLALRGRSSDNEAQAEFWSYDGSTRYGVLGSTSNYSYFGSIANTPLFFQTNSIERMRIASDGTTTIKTDGTTQLILNRADSSIFADNTIGTIQATADDPSAGQLGGQIQFTGGGTWSSNNYPTNIIFSNDSSGTLTERARITSGGDFLIGKTSTANAGAGLILYKDSTDGGVIKYTRQNNTSSQAPLVFFTNSGGVVGSVQTTNSATSYNTSSDYRLKENVVEMTDALDRVSQLKPSRFNFISDVDKTVDGFLAHEVQDIVPEAITGEKDAMQDEEYEITPAKYKTVVHPAEDAVYKTIEHPAIEEELDDEGNVIVEGKEAYTEEILVTEAKEEWSEEVLESEAVMGTRQVPNYQGIDQSKLVPLLVGAIQELKAEIDELKKNCNCN